MIAIFFILFRFDGLLFGVSGHCAIDCPPIPIGHGVINFGAIDDPLVWKMIDFRLVNFGA